MTLRSGPPFVLPSFLDTNETYICCAYTPRSFVIQKVRFTHFIHFASKYARPSNISIVIELSERQRLHQTHVRLLSIWKLFLQFACKEHLFICLFRSRFQ
ncbi:hypothetical protein B4U80_07675 [Leptotrombidium deliense]|uniref:Uncharacterized protein n=1 Tax=Leptotrombidium deliense TaxID=299467 RepID=A0A443RXQ5_9ACAR|nr:hypothetical protein B4U80_07675 [Leptotrombidium deliense]